MVPKALPCWDRGVSYQLRYTHSNFSPQLATAQGSPVRAGLCGWSQQGTRWAAEQSKAEGQASCGMISPLSQATVVATCPASAWWCSVPQREGDIWAGMGLWGIEVQVGSVFYHLWKHPLGRQWLFIPSLAKRAESGNNWTWAKSK